MKVTASCKLGLACTIFACEPDLAKTWIRLYDLLQQIGATIIYPPQEGTWAPGYYSVPFEDPDGIRLEVNFVPGAGVLHRV
jgi:uncharacterized glyoxalase superfamily protein PhnB